MLKMIIREVRVSNFFDKAVEKSQDQKNFRGGI